MLVDCSLEYQPQCCDCLWHCFSVWLHRHYGCYCCLNEHVSSICFEFAYGWVCLFSIFVHVGSAYDGARVHVRGSETQDQPVLGAGWTPDCACTAIHTRSASTFSTSKMRCIYQHYEDFSRRLFKQGSTLCFFRSFSCSLLRPPSPPAGQLSCSNTEGDGNPKLWVALSVGRVVVFDAASWSMLQDCIQVGSSQLVRTPCCWCDAEAACLTQLSGAESFRMTRWWRLPLQMHTCWLWWI